MMKPVITTVISVALLLSLGGPVSHAAMFDTEAAFLAALTGTTSTLDFESQTSGTTISTGGSLGGLTFTYTIPTGVGGDTMQVIDQFDTTSGSNYLGLDNPDAAFFDGDTFTVSFDPNTTGVGLYLISSDPLLAGEVTLTTPQGGVSNTTNFTTLGDGGLAYFLGFTSSTAFPAFTLASPGGGFFVFNIDDITTEVAPVPAPSALLLFGSGLLGLLGYRRLTQRTSEAYTRRLPAKAGMEKGHRNPSMATRKPEELAEDIRSYLITVIHTSKEPPMPNTRSTHVLITLLLSSVLLVMTVSPASARPSLSGLQAQIDAQAALIATLQADLANALSMISDLQSSPVFDLEGLVTVDETSTLNGVVAPHIIVEGANLHVRSGSGATNDGNNDGSQVVGRGNLIIGYNEANTVPSDDTLARGGSHNLVIGVNHQYPHIGGLVAGGDNVISARSASVSGGNQNTASGLQASVSGGFQNTASGLQASVSGGNENTASNTSTSVSGGFQNTASALSSSVSGGRINEASGLHSSVSGGSRNTASGNWSSVSGGNFNAASGSTSSVSGGIRNAASDTGSSVSGGEENTASALGSSVSGGLFNTASGNDSSVSGGESRSATGLRDWRAGSLLEDN